MHVAQPYKAGNGTGGNLKHRPCRKLAQLWALQARILRRLNPRRHNGRKRTGPKPSGCKVKRYRAIREESTWGLATSVALASDKFFERRGITPDLPSAWAKRINYQLDDE